MKLRKINKEEEGYSRVDHDGKTDPDLKIPEDIPYGKKKLTAKYLENEYYKPSIRRTDLYYGAKSWVFCPTIYVYDSIPQCYIYDDTGGYLQPRITSTTDLGITLRAYIFSQNDWVTHGNAKFKIDNSTVSKAKIPVTTGIVTETEEGIKIIRNHTYTCKYEGYFRNDICISEGEDTADIIMVQSPRNNRIRLMVEVTNIYANIGETVYLSARVYHEDHGESGIVNVDDHPSCGTIQFYIDGKKVGDPVSINDAGFSSMEYMISEDIGVYEIQAEYIPCDDITDKYEGMWGSGVMYVMDDCSKPNIVINTSPVFGVKENVNSIEFESVMTDWSFCDDNKVVDLAGGSITLFLDHQAVRLCDYTSGVYSGNNISDCSIYKTYDSCVSCHNKSLYTLSSVLEKNLFYTNFYIPTSEELSDTLPLQDYVWDYSGYHNMILAYTTTDGKTYYYYYPDMYIQAPTRIQIIPEGYDNKSILWLAGKDSEDNTTEPLEIMKFPENSKNKEDVIALGDHVDIEVISEEELDNKTITNKKVERGVVTIEFISRVGENR